MLLKHIEAYAGLRELVVELYDSLPEEIKEAPAAENIRILLFPPEAIQVGDLMADAELPEYKGGLRRLSEFQGKFILPDFWFWDVLGAMRRCRNSRKCMKNGAIN